MLRRALLGTMINPSIASSLRIRREFESGITIIPAQMITLHHLNDSRSQRILWLLEELGTPYEMRRYQRNAETRLAPPELKAVHPLGKSPVIIDGDVRIAESGAIVDYIIRRYGQGNGKPA